MIDDEAQASGADLASLYTRWRLPVQRMLRRYFGSPAEVEDAAQEVFVRMAANGRHLSAEEEQPYLRQTLRSVASHVWNKSAGAKNVQLVSFEACGDELHSVAAAPDADTQIQAGHRQRLVRLHQAVTELPARQREAFVLHRVEGYTVQETADRMAVSPRMVVKHLSRAVAYCETRVHYTSVDQMQKLQSAHRASAECDPEVADAAAASRAGRDRP